MENFLTYIQCFTFLQVDLFQYKDILNIVKSSTSFKIHTANTMFIFNLQQNILCLPIHEFSMIILHYIIIMIIFILHFHGIKCLKILIVI